eukprot:scaffold38127_cov105-Skeletonema_dohrnii-CCMP3373.AAC.1
MMLSWADRFAEEHSTTRGRKMSARTHIGISSMGGERRLERMVVKMMGDIQIYSREMIRIRWSM